MTKTMRIVVFTMGVAALVAPAARAQGPGPAQRGYFNISGGAQPQRRIIETSESFPLYGETAHDSTSQRIGNGAILDVGGGYRVWRSLAVGVSISSFGDTSNSTVNATIPNPLFFDQPKSTTITVPDLDHSEVGIHLQAVWFLKFTEKIDFALSIGPSFTRVHQQYVSSITVPAGTQDVQATVSEVNSTASSANIGLDATYLFTRNFGAGLFIRQAGGSIELPGAGTLSVGGFHVGIGGRIRF